MPRPEKNTSQLGKILADTSGPLAGTLAHAASLKRLQPLVVQALPADLAAHCLPANLRGNTLVIHADSPAWAAKMRFHAPQLVQRLRREKSLAELARCEVRVSPASAPVMSTKPVAAAISTQSREQLRTAAKGFKDPRLQTAFQRLAAGKSEGK
jgi:hypothetical protein